MMRGCCRPSALPVAFRSLADVMFGCVPCPAACVPFASGRVPGTLAPPVGPLLPPPRPPDDAFHEARLVLTVVLQREPQTQLTWGVDRRRGRRTQSDGAASDPEVEEAGSGDHDESTGDIAVATGAAEGAKATQHAARAEGAAPPTPSDGNPRAAKAPRRVGRPAASSELPVGQTQLRDPPVRK